MVYLLLWSGLKFVKLAITRNNMLTPVDYMTDIVRPPLKVLAVGCILRIS